LPFFIVSFFTLWTTTEGLDLEPRGEIRVVESWRPDITVLGHNVLEGLFEYALNKNESSACLAVSWEWTNDMTLEVKLRTGVCFHNGEPFDAHSVKFNFEYQRKHNPSRGIQVYLRYLKDIQIVDRYTVRMILKQPDALFINTLGGMGSLGPTTGWVMGAPQYMEQVGWNGFLKRPVGTGPYMVAGEVKDYRGALQGEAYATLATNPDYWKKGHPRISKVTFVRYRPKEALRALIEGSVDLVTSLIPKETLKAEKSQHSKVVKGRQDVRYTIGLLNMLSPHTLPLRNIRVREALNYAINDEELMRYAFKGNAMKMRGVLTEKSGVDLSDTKAYTWNIPKARELMREAGYGDGFKMKLLYGEYDFLIAQFLQRFYRLLKIETELIPCDLEKAVQHVVYPNSRGGYSWENQDWWIGIFSQPGYNPEVGSHMLGVFFHSKAPWRSAPDWLLYPLDKLYHEVHKTKDPHKRFRIYKEANEYIADQALWVFTVAPFGLYGVNEEVEFMPHPSQYLYLDYSFVTDEHWSLREKNN
jgi:peptide/nickel transport system substrate-binding protein